MRVILDTEDWPVNGHTRSGVSLLVEPIVGTLKLDAQQYESVPSHLGNSSFHLTPQRINLDFDFMVSTVEDFNRAQELSFKASWMRQFGLVDDFTVQILDYFVADRETRQRSFCGTNPSTLTVNGITLVKYQPQLFCKLKVTLKSRNLSGGIFSVQIRENFKVPDKTCPDTSIPLACPLSYSYNGSEEGTGFPQINFFRGLSFDFPTYRGYQIGVNDSDVSRFTRQSSGVSFVVQTETRAADVAYVLINSLTRFQFVSSSAPAIRLDQYSSQITYSLGGFAPPENDRVKWCLVMMQDGILYYKPTDMADFPTLSGVVDNTGTVQIPASVFTPVALWDGADLYPSGVPPLNTSLGAPDLEVGIAMIVDPPAGGNFQCEVKTWSGSWQDLGGDRICYGVDFPRPVDFTGIVISGGGGGS